MRVAVMGAGIVGAAVARSLAARGAGVTVVEAVRPGHGTSGTTFAWVNAHDKRPRSYHRLNVAGCNEHRRFAEGVSPGRQWFFPVGNLVWAPEGSDDGLALRERVDRLQRWDYPCHWLDRDQVASVEPDVRLSRDVERVACFPGEGYVLPALLLGALLGEARDHGAEVRSPLQVTGAELRPDGVELRFSDGGSERFDRVVSCAGRWTQQLSEVFGAPVPLVDPDEPAGPAVGFLGYTSPLPLRLAHLLTTPRINVRPDGGGRTVVQGLDLDAEADPANPPGPGSRVAVALAERLREVLRLHGPVDPPSVRVGQRVLPADGLTVAGWLPGTGDRCYVVATHSGVTLGPLLGRLVAGEVAGEATEPLLAEFRPTRFGAPAAATRTARTVQAARRPGEQ